MRVLLLFMVFAAVVFIILVGLYLAAHIRAVLYNTMNVVSNIRSILYDRVYDLCNDCRITIKVSGLEITQVGVTEGVYNDGYAHVIVPAGKCVSLASKNFKRTYTLCAGSVDTEFRVMPGLYYIELMPTKPVSLSVEAAFSWLPYALLLVLFIALVIVFAYTTRR